MLAVSSHFAVVLGIGRSFHEDLFCSFWGTEVRVVILLFPRCFFFSFLKVTVYIYLFPGISTNHHHYSLDVIFLSSIIYASHLDP